MRVVHVETREFALGAEFARAHDGEESTTHDRELGMPKETGRSGLAQVRSIRNNLTFEAF
jgi:hypothetical protein